MRLLIFITAILFSLPSFSGLVVIVHPDNNNKLSDLDIRNLFLSKTEYYPDGTSVKIYNYTGDNELQQNFYKKVLRKSESSVNAYWARILFSSKGAPPEEVANAQDLINRVAKNKSAISFIDSSQVDSSVKVIYKLQ